ncbi:MAG: molybdopterin-synthase adenylyltransferase MoeB [Candidatus Nanopelagicaceae bacterium]
MAELLHMKALVEPGRALTNEEKQRYSRHLLIPDVDLLGQQRLINAKVLCIGAGGLGSPTILYLAAAGVGTIGILDFDQVEISNLQRQIIHSQTDVGKSKVQSAAEKAKALNPSINLNLHQVRLDESNALEIFANYDLIIDGTDNFATRYLINDAAALLGKPYIWGSIYRFDGQASVFWSEHGPCYRCLHPSPPPPGLVPSCAEGGVLGSLCGAIGAIQSTEAIKLITGIGHSLLGELLIHSALDTTYQKIKIEKNPNCPICNGTQTKLLPSYQALCNPGVFAITTEELAVRLLAEPDLVLVDVREPDEFAAGAISGALLLPVAKFFDGSALQLLPRDQEIVLYCRSGVRSANCLEILRGAGFLQSAHLEGGILAWQGAGQNLATYESNAVRDEGLNER